MPVNTAKRRMLEGKPALGVVAGLGSPTATGMLAQAGFDFILVDNQHGDWDDASSLAAFRAICLGTAVPMARVRQNDFAAIGRLLDRGALGLAIPMVNSAEEARAAAYAMRYPPRGGRSAGWALLSHYAPGYDRWADDEVFLAVQIETAQAARQAREILSVAGVDGCWVGPVDLARSLGVNRDTVEGARLHEEAILGVLDACHQTGKIPGIHANTVAEAEHWLERGFLFVTVSSDIWLLQEAATAALCRLGRR